jgi:hypothetical protein
MVSNTSYGRERFPALLLLPKFGQSVKSISDMPKILKGQSNHNQKLLK